MEIDNYLNNFPKTPRSALPYKASIDIMDPHVLKPPNLVQLAPPIPQVSALCPANTPAKHVGDSDNLQTVGPKKLLDPSQGTWKRLRPPKQVLDIKSTGHKKH